jgi:hypothetical protein
MKSTFIIATAALALVAPVSLFAQQSAGSLTRAEVRKELVQLERVGYNRRDWNHYPDNIQAAQRRVDAQRVSATDTRSE